METSENEILLQVFSSVFEEFAFMFVEEDGDDPGEDKGLCPCLLAEIGFTGSDKKGVLEVAAPAEICDELAENILGLEQQELPEGAGENALTEVLNVACGYFLAEKYGTDEVFDLSIPETSEVSDEQWAEMASEGRYIRLLVDESPFMAKFAVRQ
ncbi:MAG: chemotaxis protein CheX [Desulfosalsimonas sp.]